MQKNTTKKNTKRVAIVGGTTAALLGGGIAFATWTTNGTGSGTAQAGDAVTTSISGAASNLLPNTTVPMTVTVSNTNPYAVHVDSITPTNDKVSANPGACNADSVSAGSFTTSEAGSSSTKTSEDPTSVVPAGSTTNPGTQTFTIQVSMTTAANESCKGATFTIPFTATGHSVASS